MAVRLLSNLQRQAGPSDFAQESLDPASNAQPAPSPVQFAARWAPEQVRGDTVG